MIKEIETCRDFLQNGRSLVNKTVQSIDFRKLNVTWSSIEISNTTFLGCEFKKKDRETLFSRGARIYEAPQSLPYLPFRKELYNGEELSVINEEGKSTDLLIYEHFQKERFNPDINEALWQRIHDHAIDDALRELIGLSHDGVQELRCVGMMGGHSTHRDSVHYQSSAKLAKKLTECGYFIVSGGGPGIMEAANLGAYFAGRPDEQLVDAIMMMSASPHYDSGEYTELARQILDLYPSDHRSLAIPTWFYGHEPSNVFASHIAKYFSNSIREETLLAICHHGVIFAPGSVGTHQEIFMDLAQNFYQTYGSRSPMLFLGVDHYMHKIGLFPVIRNLVKDHPLADFLFCTDSPEEAVDFIQEFTL